MQLSKIQRALLMAFVGSKERPDVSPLVGRVADRLIGEKEPVKVDRVAELIERVLVEAGHGDVASKFLRYRLERDIVRARRLRPDSGAISDYIHVAKYARHKDGRRELYHETVDRVRSMHLSRWPHLEAEIAEAFSYVYTKRVMPSMRSMQFAGPAIEADNARMYNCSFTHVDRWAVFREIFYLLLCGCGVGYSVQWRHIDRLGELKAPSERTVVHHSVEDTIRGWANAADALIYSYVEGGYYVEFNYSRIRAEGSLLKTSGGRAPGHLPLKRSLERIRTLLDGAIGRKLRPLEAHDIICYLAEAVLAGGIRRSSLLALFSDNDTEMMYCKAKGNFRPAFGSDPGLNSHREMANNSVALLRGGDNYSVFRRAITIAQGNYGCPGFYLTNNLDYGPNPCGEIGMWPVYAGASGVQFCNLTEVNCSGADKDELIKRVKAASFIGTLQAAYTSFPYLGEVTEAITRRDALLGVGLTGIMDNVAVALNGDILRECARVACDENTRVAALIGINTAARVTTIKPSGTSSLEMGGIGSGMHARWARRYIRRVTANPNEEIARYFRENNPHMIEEKPNGDWAICFPIQTSDDAITVRDQSADDQLDIVLRLYNDWIVPGTRDSIGLTHNVSSTITIKDGELEGLIESIWKHKEQLCAISFVPSTIDRKFRYAPNEAIDTPEQEARWNDLIRLYKSVDWSKFVELEEIGRETLEAACAAGGCEQ